jgi:hypothetical protein
MPTRIDTSMPLPDPRKSRAVLIGASRFADASLPDLPAVRDNLDGLARCLRSPALWGLPEAHCTVVADPQSAVALLNPVHDASAAAEDTLLVYYAGHGLIHPLSLELLLAVVSTTPDRNHTAVPYDQVREKVVDSPAVRKVVILDCCYSGRAFSGMADPTTTVANQAIVEGTYLLASAPPNKQALSLPGETYTAFTGALLKLFNEGLPDGPELLQLNTIYRQIRETLKRASRPVPQLRVDNTAGELALVRNQWHRSSPRTLPKRGIMKWRPQVNPQYSYQLFAEFDRAEQALLNNHIRERVKELVREAGMIGTYACPICQVTLAGENLIRHVDEHRSNDTASLNPTTVTLEARPERLDDRYLLGDVIGGRRKFRVRIATDLLANQTVVVKLLSAAHDSPVIHNMRKVAQFDHPGIVRVLDIAETTTRSVTSLRYIVMEYIDGQPLNDVLRSHALLEPSWAARIVHQVCNALSYGHKKGVMHGDLSSRNAMVTRDGTVKLLNFGTRYVTGADIRSDVYSAGRLLLELLTGKTPSLTSPTLPQPPRNLPPALADVISIALRADGAAGYPSAHAMSCELARIR